MAFILQFAVSTRSNPYRNLISRDVLPHRVRLLVLSGNCSLPHKESIVTTQWAPAMDGMILPAEPVALLEAGKAAMVPVLLGSNKNEGSTFVTRPPRTATDFTKYFDTTFGAKSGPAIAAQYMPPNVPGKRMDPYMYMYAYHDASQYAVGDFDLRCTTVMAAKVFASEGRPTYLYSYDHTPTYSVNEGHISSHLGAFHGSEVPFVFYDDFELSGGELDLSARAWPPTGLRLRRPATQMAT